MSLRTLVPWRQGLANPGRAGVDPFLAWQEDFHRAVNNLFNGNDLLAPVATGMSTHLDVSETDQEYHLTMELPGMSEKDVEVELLDEGIKIHGEKKDERETKDHQFHRTERTFGMFERIIPLPKPVNRDAVVATFKNGVLTVVLPKAEPAVTHQKISVQPG